MGSRFDSLVYQRRNAAPWAQVSFQRFAVDMLWNSHDTPADHKVVLTVQYRPDVNSSTWWRLEWTGADEQRHAVESQYYDLLLWQAVETEIQVRAREEVKHGAEQSD